MNRLLIALCCVLSFAIPALAAPGEPRFLQGTVEWPAALNGEPGAMGSSPAHFAAVSPLT